MKLYWVGYDLMSPGKDYSRLTTELVALGAERILLSDWALKSNYTAAQLRDHLKQFLDRNDRLMVAEVGNWASWNAMADINKVGLVGSRN